MIYSIGETAFDIIFKNNEVVESKVGGSMLNTAISLGRLGLSVEFISTLGNDQIGDLTTNFLNQNGVGTRYVSRHNGKSFVALVFLDANNNAQYSFYDDQSVKKGLLFPEVQENDILLFGSLLSINTAFRSQFLGFLQQAKARKAIIIYDPNFREDNLPNLLQVKPLIEENIEFADIVKGSDEDFEHIFGAKKSEDVYKTITKQTNKSLIYTAGKNGGNIHFRDISLKFSVPSIDPISTIGAGDNFNAGLIYSLIKLNISQKSLTFMERRDYEVIAENGTRFAQQVCMSYDNYISNGFAKSL